MILNDGYKPGAFLRSISLHLTGDQKWEQEKSGEELVYFGGGYWRGKWNENRTGIRLINPSVSEADTRVVEQSLCVLLCGKFVATETE